MATFTPEETKAKVVFFRCTPIDYMMLKKEAEEKKTKVSRLLRAIVWEHLHAVKNGNNNR